MKRFFKILLKITFAMVLIYLVLPPAEIPPLPESLKSTEPGDTVEIPGVSAYYTSLTRKEIVEFYRRNFSQSRLLKLPLPVIILSHPPEYTNVVIRDTVPSTHLYELVHPLRDSLYISGWDPRENPKYKNNQELDQVFQEKGVYYERKTTLRYLGSAVVLRILIFLIAGAVFLKLLSEIKKTFVLWWQKWR